MDQKTAVIGRLCWELSDTKTKNELEAIEEKILKLDRVISTKVNHEIDAAKDIELHGALQLVRMEYINAGKVFAS